MNFTFLQGEAVALGPLRIRLDGDDAATDVTPEATCAPGIGDRVLCLLLGQQLIVIGVIATI